LGKSEDIFVKRSGGKKDDDDKSDHNRWVDFNGEKRPGETHESKTDAEARLYTKSSGQSAKLQFMGHVTMENRNGVMGVFNIVRINNLVPT
jgi:hypothetical protein